MSLAQPVSAIAAPGSTAELDGLCLHRLFEAQVARTPDSVALIFDAERTTFAELDARATVVARGLQALGVGPEALVGVCIDRSPDAVAAILGVLKAGGAYVPLDPAHPRDRLAQIVDDARLRVVLTTTSLLDRVPRTVPEIVCVDREPAAGASAAREVACNATVDNAAYVIYTSGSTGTPKGVVRVHRGLMSRMPWATFAQDEICCLNTSLSVGYSVHRLFLPLLCGVPVVLLAERIVKDPNLLVSALESEGVTNAAFVPSVLRQLLDLGPSLSARLRRLRTVTVGGSSVSRELAAAFVARLPHARLFNQYGSTETGPAILGEVTETPLGLHVPAGMPTPNTRIHVLDEAARPVEPGTCGEIYVAGVQLARGYLHNPALTAKRFVHLGGERLYRTGDLGRYLPDGRLEIIGRIDNQVKVRGFRIELEEVEAVLRQDDGVREAVVSTQEFAGETRLIGYFVAKPGRIATVREIRERMLRSLPEHMVPASFVVLERLPLTDAGKVDRSALCPTGGNRLDLSSPYQAPRDPREDAVAAILAELLGLEQIGVHDHFLELGGNSVIAVQLKARLRDRFDVEIPLEGILDGTVATLGARLAIELETAPSLDARSPRS